MIAALSSTASAGYGAEKTLSGMITITNMAPTEGTFQTPVWAGIHNGDFDIYDRNKTVTVAVERLAEDGNVGLLISDFAASEGAVWDGVVGEAPFGPGATVELPFEITVKKGYCHYFSYASMVLPSNDFWIANGNPMAYEVINAYGEFIGTEFMVFGDQVLDAGTEVNDELPANTAFLNQSMPDTGINEDGFVTLATEGFKPAGEGGVLDEPMFANADFTAEGYQMIKVTVSEVSGRRASVRGAN
ncbi:MAG: hypothetical protein SGILL_003669 [Bacillariaceae sp.]